MSVSVHQLQSDRVTVWAEAISSSSVISEINILTEFHLTKPDLLPALVIAVIFNAQVHLLW